MEDRRKEDRRKLYGKPFLAMLIGGLPEDRRKCERRSTTQPWSGSDEVTPESVATIRGDFTAATEAVEAPL
ncbi:MAG: hypothetical protein QOJ39_1743 [Candidatus Eremiobacteraeota bacterium]|nr:hypothetical protein [Candidatus Eremiobacteraeota bacterium]